MKCPECKTKNGKKNMFCEFCGFNLLHYKTEQNLLLIQAKNEFLIQKETEKIRKRIHEKERELNLLIQIHKIKTDPEVYNSLRNCWSDNSHKQGIETGSAEFADFLFQNERINNHEIKKINITVGTLGIMVFITGILLMIFF